MHSKDRCKWRRKRLQAARRVSRKAEFILSTDNNLNTNNDENENRGTVVLFLNPLVLTKLSEQNHLTQQLITELLVSLIVNNEEHLLRALADTGDRSSIILEANNSASFIKIDDSNTTTWSTMGGKFTTTKSGICLWHFHSQSSILRNKWILLGHFM
jgi:hypothetical protein